MSRTFVIFPPARIRANISPHDWTICLECWVTLIQQTLLTSKDEFSSKFSNNKSVIHFLLSYMKETSSFKPDVNSQAEKNLRKKVFLLTHRIFNDTKSIPVELLQWTFLGNLSMVYPRSQALKNLLELIWDREDLENQASMQASMNPLVKIIESSSKGISPEFEIELWRLVSLMKTSFRFSQFMMLGSDFLDALSNQSEKTPSEYRNKLSVLGYLGLLSLLNSRRPRISLFVDHVYSLLNSSPISRSFLRNVLSHTPLLRRLKGRSFSLESERTNSIMLEIQKLEKETPGGFPTMKNLHKPNKGKARARDNDAENEMYVHKLSLVTQIQDLFPDLGSGFVVKLLDEYNDNIEQVTAHLLENSLPLHLAKADQHETLANVSSASKQPNLKPSSQTNRRNIYDNDPLDLLSVPASSLSLGPSSQTADTLLSAPPSSSAKAAILSALASFDSDSDEHDDTYDIEDVGGTVDSSLPGSTSDMPTDSSNVNDNDEALFTAFKSYPEFFDQNAKTRRTDVRTKLKADTGMTDEAIEGWAMMLQRDPRRMRRLEAQFSTTAATQRNLPSTAYREHKSVTGDSDSEVGQEGVRSAGRGQGSRGGSRGRGVRGGGHAVAGSPDSKGTQLARQQKDAHKASRANHNRRDQRAKKMARGFGGGGLGG